MKRTKGMAGPEEKSVIHTRKHLTDKIRQLQGLNHIIAHNFRGAIANIKMLTEILIAKKIPEECAEGVAAGPDGGITTTEALTYIQESSESLLGTLGTLMDVADIELDQAVSIDNCNIVTIVKHVTDQLKGFVLQKKAVIELNLQITDISFPISYMESLIYNLISNALKYSRQNVPLRIVISTYQADGRTILSVKDNGLGIDLKANKDKLFTLKQVVYKGDDSKGIGLYITKTQIEACGGSINVKSKLGEGSEFIVTF